MKKDGLKLADVISEKEMQSKDGFASRKHYPDFMFVENGDTYCVEVELTLKNKTRLAKNIQMNFIEYGYQIWIVSKNDTSIRRFLQEKTALYPSIADVIDIESVREYVRLDN